LIVGAPSPRARSLLRERVLVLRVPEDEGPLVGALSDDELEAVDARDGREERDRAVRVAP
jgi:hypothetical protein